MLLGHLVIIAIPGNGEIGGREPPFDLGPEAYETKRLEQE